MLGGSGNSYVLMHLCGSARKMHSNKRNAEDEVAMIAASRVAERSDERERMDLRQAVPDRTTSSECTTMCDPIRTR